MRPNGTGERSDNRNYPVIRNTKRMSTECLLNLRLNYEENYKRCQVKTSHEGKQNLT